MNINLLKTFLEVARLGHFGKAADRVCLTQAAVSARIKQIEDKLGVTLFTRKRNDIQLTAEGRRLAVAAEKTDRNGGRVTYIWQNAMQLPFPDGVFDLVTCLEALEFMPDPEQVLKEIVRVARPGAPILVTHRRGWERRVMPGKCWSEDDFKSLLEGIGLRNLSLIAWQQDYSLVWGRAGSQPEIPDERPGEIIRCMVCSHPPMVRDGDCLRCLNCGTHYSIAVDGIVEMHSHRPSRRRQ